MEPYYVFASVLFWIFKLVGCCIGFILTERVVCFLSTVRYTVRKLFLLFCATIALLIAVYFLLL
jgi:hypothetical protein